MGGIVMALYDWNRNGKKDAVDDFIEFNIMKSMSKGSSENNHFLLLVRLYILGMRI